MYRNITIEKFLGELASKNPTPGGGSTSALLGALGINLIQMVARLTINKKKYKAIQIEVEELLHKIEKISDEFLNLMEKDALAYNEVSKAYQLAKENDSEIAIRNNEIQKALIKAIESPLDIIELLNTSLDIFADLSEKLNSSAYSDLEVALQCYQAAAKGAYANILINIKALSSIEIKNKYQIETDKKLNNLLNQIDLLEQRIMSKITKE